MATIDETVRRLQEKVEEAKKGVRATMTVEELSRESIRDIIKEVGEANALATELFDREDNKLGVTTRHLRTELVKLVEEGSDASKDRLKEIEQRAKDIAIVAAEADTPEEQAYLGELAANVQGAARKARGTAAGLGGGGGAIGESLFTGIFGNKFGKWMLNAPGGGNQAKRSVADLRLEIAEAQRDAVTDGDGGGAGFESEAKEEEREAKIRETEVRHKEDDVISLLHQILTLLGRNGRGLGGGVGGTDKDGDGKPDGDGGAVDTAIDIATNPFTVAAVTTGITATLMHSGARGKIFQFFARMLGLGRGTAHMAPIPTGTLGSRITGGSAGRGRNLVGAIQPAKSTAAAMTHILHVGADGTRVTMSSAGKLSVRSASGGFIKNQAAYLKNIGLPTHMPAGSTVDDALKLAMKKRKLANAVRPGWLRRAFTISKGGLGGALRAEAMIFAPIIAGTDVLMGMTEKYEQMAAGEGTGTIGDASFDKAAGLYGAARAVEGLAWLNSLVGQDIGTTEEIAQGIEAIIGVDDSKQWERQNIILPAMRRNRQKDLVSMAGGHSLQTTLGRRLFYSGQLMRLLYEKAENPSLDKYRVWHHDQPPTNIPKPVAIASAVNRLINQTAYAIAEDEANTNKTAVDDDRIIQIIKRLRSGDFHPTDTDAGVTLIPLAGINKKGVVQHRRQTIHKMMQSGGSWNIFESSLSPSTHIAKVAARGNVDAIRALGDNARLSMFELDRMYGRDQAMSIYQNFQDIRSNSTVITESVLNDEDWTYDRNRANVGEVNLSLE